MSSKNKHASQTQVQSTILSYHCPGEWAPVLTCQSAHVLDKTSEARNIPHLLWDSLIVGISTGMRLWKKGNPGEDKAWVEP